MVIPKVLCVYVHRPMSVGLFLRSAFRQAGCDVRSIGPSLPQVYGRPDGTEHTFPPEDYVAPDIEIANTPVAVKHVVDWASGDWRPDLLCEIDQYDALHLTGNAPLGVKYAHIAVENWNAEQRQRYAQRCADAEFHMIAHSNQALLPEGSTFLPFGADPFTHPLLGAPRDKWVCQIGTAYEPRPAVWNALAARFDGASPLSQPEYLERHRETAHTIFGRIPSYQGMAEAYNRSLCALSASNCDFLPMRFPEAMAMGCVMVSDDQPVLRATFGAPYPENPDGVWLRHHCDAQSVGDAVEWVATHERERLGIVARAFTEVCARHWYYHRARAVLAAVGLQGATRLV